MVVSGEPCDSVSPLLLMVSTPGGVVNSEAVPPTVPSLTPKPPASSVLLAVNVTSPSGVPGADRPGVIRAGLLPSAPGARSLTRLAVAPFQLHNSLPCTPSSAEKNSVPFNSAKLVGSAFPVGSMVAICAVPPSVPSDDQSCRSSVSALAPKYSVPPFTNILPTEANTPSEVVPPALAISTSAPTCMNTRADPSSSASTCVGAVLPRLPTSVGVALVPSLVHSENVPLAFCTTMNSEFAASVIEAMAVPAPKSSISVGVDAVAVIAISSAWLVDGVAVVASEKNNRAPVVPLVSDTRPEIVSAVARLTVFATVPSVRYSRDTPSALPSTKNATLPSAVKSVTVSAASVLCGVTSSSVVVFELTRLSVSTITCPVERVKPTTSSVGDSTARSVVSAFGGSGPNEPLPIRRVEIGVPSVS